MIVKLFGGLCVVLACGGCGFMIAANARREVMTLRQLIDILDLVECELSYRMLPLAQLFRSSVGVGNGCINRFFRCLADELEMHSALNVEKCVNSAITSCPDLPPLIIQRVKELGKTLGRFELTEQLKCIRGINDENRKLLDKLIEDHESKTRSYKTLGLCAGAALVILFI